MHILNIKINSESGILIERKKKPLWKLCQIVWLLTTSTFSFNKYMLSVKSLIYVEQKSKYIKQKVFFCFVIITSNITNTQIVGKTIQSFPFFCCCWVVLYFNLKFQKRLPNDILFSLLFCVHFWLLFEVRILYMSFHISTKLVEQNERNYKK